MTVTCIIMGNYLRNEVWKGNKQQTDDQLSELIDSFAQKHNNENLNKMNI